MKAFLARMRSEWAARTARERQILSAGAVVLAALLAWAIIWKPLTDLHARRVADLDTAREIAAQLERLAAEGGSQSKRPGANSRSRSLMAIVDQSSKRSQIGKTPTRIQPDGETTVRVWFEDVPFDSVLRWLSELSSRDGVQVSEADIERQSGNGLVNARVTLVRP